MSDGEIMVGNYQLKNCVSSGSTTQIWECQEVGSPVQLAMKLMLEDSRKDAGLKAVLKHEFKVGKSLEHPAFLRFHDLEINRDHAFFTMDFFRSPSLKNHITTNLTAIQSVFKKLAESLAQAFGYMHEQGWLHRDIKPDNILVNKAGEARVIDFNLAARVKGAVGMLLSGKQKAIQGTRTYIAPETILKKSATPQTDMYSLGVAFFEVLTGVPPFAGDSPNDLLKKHLGEDPVAPSVFNPNATKDIDRIVLQMLNKDPKKRFDTMQDIAREIAKIKCFEVDPLELRDKKLREEKELQAASVDKRLDSRADAERTAKGIAAPAKHEKKPVRMSKDLLRELEKQKAAEAAKNQPQLAQQPMQAPMPYPGMPMPMAMQPGMPYPGMPMPQGMPYPGMPMQGGMAYPGMPAPGQPMHPQAMQGQLPQAPAPAETATPPPSPQPQPAAPAPAAAPVQQAPATSQPEALPSEEPREATLEDMMDLNIE